MNVLILSNSAPNYFNFFNKLASLIANEGANVYFAVDCNFSKKGNKLDKTNYQSFVFSDFFRNHITDKKILKKYSDYNLNAALLSDFERAEIYRIWGNKTSLEYFDRLKSALLSFFEELITSKKIDNVIYENVSNAFAHFAFYVAQKNGVRYVGIGGSRLPSRFSVTSDPLKDDAAKIIFDQIQSQTLIPEPKVREWATDYISNIENIVPDYMKINRLDRIDLAEKYLKKSTVSKLFNILPHVFDSRTDAFQMGNPLITHANLFLRNVRRKIKTTKLQRYYTNFKLPDEDFLIYPLHFHPESSTSILAGTYLNEYEVIRNIAFNLPEGIRLYVKDHISAWGYPPIEFYKKINRLPNVRVLPPTYPIKSAIKKSLGVITLTSTAGYEALLLKKRVYLFGNVFYGFHKGVVKVKNPSEIHKLLVDWIYKNSDWTDSYNNDFVCAYYYATLNGKLNLTANETEASEYAAKVYKNLRAPRKTSPLGKILLTTASSSKNPP